MAVMSYTVQQVSRYTPVADELETMLKIIQNDWGCKVISVCETTVNKTPDCSSQAFIIIYDNTQKDLQPVKRGRWIDCTFYDPYEKSYKQNFEYKCSCCGHMIYNKPNDDNQYCGHCSARMDGEQNE